MTLTVVEREKLPSVRALRASADVVMVDEGGGFRASLLLVPGRVAVARLDRSLRGHPEEGRVLYEVMMASAGANGPGYFCWAARPDHGIPAVPGITAFLLWSDDWTTNSRGRG